MASINDFWIYVYEFGYLLNLVDGMENFNEYGSQVMTDVDKFQFKSMVHKIQDFDFKQMNEIASKLVLMRKDWNRVQSQQHKFEKIHDKFEKIKYQQYRMTGEKKALIIVFYSESEIVPKIQETGSTYRFLTASTIIRDGKKYPVDDKLILDIFKENPSYYLDSLFVDQDVQLLDIIKSVSGMFERYFNKHHPIYHKNSMRREKTKGVEQDIECLESRNGILRGLVHKIGYTGYDEQDDQFLMMIMSSGYLEIQFHERNPSSGVFTTILGYGNTVERMYGCETGIYFILSLAALEDFDYWGGEHGMGARKTTDFYKGICHKCGDEMEKYSAAERCFLSAAGDNHRKFYELIFSGDLNLRRYLQAIYVPDDDQRQGLMESELIRESTKTLIISDIPDDMVFRKGCLGDVPKQINKKEMIKAVKIIQKREKMDTIPKINYQTINMKRKVKILYDPLKSEGGMDFPTPE